MQIASYRTEISTTIVVMAKVGWYCIWRESTKWFKIYDIFFIIFYSTDNSKTTWWAKIQHTIEAATTNLIIDLTIKIF